MPSAPFVIAVVFSAFLALWPIAFVAALVQHAWARRWARVGQLALLLPLWTVAASIGLVQFPRLLAALGGSEPGRWGVAFAAVVLALCCGAVAWALLLRSFARPAAGGRFGRESAATDAPTELPP